MLDEATAAVDVQTDATLQATLRGPQFRNKTVITIAHRINTILDSDRVVVLEKGEVVECGSPRELVERRGVFWRLVREAGLESSVLGSGGGGSGSGSGANTPTTPTRPGSKRERERGSRPGTGRE